MNLTSDSIQDGQPIDATFAFGKADPESHIALTDNKSPHLAWSGVPPGTKSFAILCVDPDVPSIGDDVNQEGKTVPADLPRVDFYHWVCTDLPADTTSLSAGAFSDGITAHGKDGPDGPLGTRQGTNDYTGWFAGDADMEGNYFGYDGPCPPWNDARLHHYHFTVYALDVESLGLSGAFTGADAKAAMEGHVLGEASIVGTYTCNPDVG